MRRELPLGTTLAALVTIGAALASPARWFAGSHPVVQGGTPKDPPQHVHHPPGSIIGSETPQLIPSEVAIGLMLRAIATAASAGDRQLAGYFGNIEGITGGQLAHEDRVAITTAAKAYVNEMSSAGQGPGRVDVARRRAETVRHVWGDLHRGLSPQGQIAIQFFVEQYVKRNVKLLNY